MSKMRLLSHRVERTSKDEIVLERPLSLRQKLRAFWGVREEGAQLVEMALVAPILLVLIVGIVIVGMDLNNYIILTDAVSAGSRAFSLARGQTSPALAGTNPCSYAVGVANADATGLNTANITYTITYTPFGGSATGEGSSCAGLALNSQDTVAIKATYPASIPLVGQNGYFLFFHVGALTLTAHNTQLVQ